MFIGDLWRRLRFLVTERYFDGDLEDEMRLHIALREKQLIERGVAPDMARREARQRFGRRSGLMEQSRDMWGLRSLESLGQDVAYAFRRLRLQSRVHTRLDRCPRAGHWRHDGHLQRRGRRAAAIAAVCEARSAGHALGRRFGDRVPEEHAGAG